MKTKTIRCWGDPLSYADRMLAKNQLKKPNKYICVCCFQQAGTEDTIKHSDSCPVRKGVPK